MTPNPDESALCQPKLPSSKRRSCDSCFRLKEKCTWSTSDDECDRCFRVARPCTALRPFQRLGRKPRYLIHLSPIPAVKASALKIPAALHPFDAVFKDLDRYEEAVVARLVDVEFFTELMTVPREGRRMHQEAMYSLLGTWDQTRDGCSSMFGAFAAAKEIEIPGYNQDDNLRRGVRALERFRTMPCPTAASDFMPWFWLGIAVLIYAHCGLGNPGTIVRRYMLHHLRQLGQRGMAFASHPSAVSLIALDIQECLFYRRLPVMNMPVSADVGTDTFFGLCAPLIQFTYELAILSRGWGEQIADAKVLTDFETSVQMWQPGCPKDWLQDLSTLEATHAISQIRVYKDMLLLFAHRLKHPFGHADQRALQMARSILSELDLATAATGQPPMWVMAPFLIAAFEVEGIDERSKIIRSIHMFGDKLSPGSQALAAEFFAGFWRYRDENFCFRWIDVMHQLPPLCLYA